MKIAFISPRKGQCGTTSIALLLALYLDSKYNKEVAYLSDSNIDDICYWNDVLISKDIMKSTSQIHQMLLTGNISLKEIKDYGTNVSNKVDVYEINKDTLTVDESLETQHYLINHLPYTTILIDLGCNYKTVYGKAAIEQCDMVVMITSSMQYLIDESVSFMEDELLEDKKKLIIINNHNDQIIEKTIIKGKGFRNNKPEVLKNCIIFPFNSRIPSYQNENSLFELAENVSKGGFPTLLCISNPLNDLADFILANSGDKTFLGGDK